jgi:hypothetical protein
VVFKNKKFWVSCLIVVGLVPAWYVVYRVIPQWITEWREAQVQHDIVVLEKALQAYEEKYGNFPSLSLEFLAERQPGGGAPLVDKRVLTDPWGQPYQVGAPRSYTLKPPPVYSMGPPGYDKRIWNPRY